jgi:uncharacterized repeat protein (TIGR03809 family)
MPERQAGKALDAVAQKWRQLAERRRAHFLELFHSGRWKLYYSEEQYLAHLSEASRTAERWALIAPLPTDVPSPVPAPVAESPSGVVVSLAERRNAA